jgi:hypothetical protein
MGSGVGPLFLDGHSLPLPLEAQKAERDQDGQRHDGEYRAHRDPFSGAVLCDMNTPFCPSLATRTEGRETDLASEECFPPSLPPVQKASATVLAWGGSCPKCPLGLSLFPSARRSHPEGPGRISMSDRSPARQPGERGRAIERLMAAVSQQSRLREEHQVAKDSTGEMIVDASLRAADEQVVARERWLKAVDDHDY